mgnify:CR=1 FL=1
MNKQILEAKQNIINVLNQAQLPIAVLDLILGDIRSGIQPQLIAEVRQEEQVEKEQAEKANGANPGHHRQDDKP